MTEHATSREAVGFRAHAAVISEPRAVVGEILFREIHAAKRGFRLRQALARSGQAESDNLSEETIPGVEIAPALTPEDTIARLDALQTMRKGKQKL